MGAQHYRDPADPIEDARYQRDRDTPGYLGRHGVGPLSRAARLIHDHAAAVDVCNAVMERATNSAVWWAALTARSFVQVDRPAAAA